MAEQQQRITIQQALELATQHHNAGRLTEAENIYQQILQNEPNQPTAIHMLGVIAYQVGKHDTAETLITKAISIEPNLAEAHCNLGLVLQELGKATDAINSYQKALSIRPNYPEVHYNMGNAVIYPITSTLGYDLWHTGH